MNLKRIAEGFAGGLKRLRDPLNDSVGGMEEKKDEEMRAFHLLR